MPRVASPAHSRLDNPLFQIQGRRNRANASAAPHTDRIVPTPVTTIHSFALSIEVRTSSIEVRIDPNSFSIEVRIDPNSFVTSALNVRNSDLRVSIMARKPLTSPLISVTSD